MKPCEKKEAPKIEIKGVSIDIEDSGNNTAESRKRKRAIRKWHTHNAVLTAFLIVALILLIVSFLNVWLRFFVLSLIVSVILLFVLIYRVNNPPRGETNLFDIVDDWINPPQYF